MLGSRVDRKCFLNLSPRRLPVSDVNLVEGVAFDDVDHIFTGACMSTIDSNATHRGVNGIRGVVNVSQLRRSAAHWLKGGDS